MADYRHGRAGRAERAEERALRAQLTKRESAARANAIRHERNGALQAIDSLTARLHAALARAERAEAECVRLLERIEELEGRPGLRVVEGTKPRRAALAREARRLNLVKPRAGLPHGEAMRLVERAAREAQ